MAGKYKSDRELLEACFSGDRNAWETFVREYSKLVYYSVHQIFKIRGMVPDSDEVDDLYGSVYLMFFENDFARLRSFKGKNDCSLASWIRLLASRKTLDYLREKGRRSRIIDHHSEINYGHPSGQNIETEALEHEQAAIFREALLELGAEDLTFLNLFYEQELPPESIARMLGVTVSTVYSKKNRLKGKLKRIIEKKQGTENK